VDSAAFLASARLSAICSFSDSVAAFFGSSGGETLERGRAAAGDLGGGGLLAVRAELALLSTGRFAIGVAGVVVEREPTGDRSVAKEGVVGTGRLFVPLVSCSSEVDAVEEAPARLPLTVGEVVLTTLTVPGFVPGLLVVAPEILRDDEDVGLRILEAEGACSLLLGTCT